MKFRDEDHCFWGGKHTLGLWDPGPETEQDHPAGKEELYVSSLCGPEMTAGQALWWPENQPMGTRKWVDIQVCAWTWMPWYHNKEM